MPQNGTYTLLVQQSLADTGSLSLALLPTNAVTLSSGGSVTFAPTQAGQPVAVTFTAVAGQVFTLSATQPMSGGSNLSFIAGLRPTLIGPAGAPAWQQLPTVLFNYQYWDCSGNTESCSQGGWWYGTESVTLPKLSQGGTYTLWLQLEGGASSTQIPAYRQACSCYQLGTTVTTDTGSVTLTLTSQ